MASPAAIARRERLRSRTARLTEESTSGRPQHTIASADSDMSDIDVALEETCSTTGLTTAESSTQTEHTVVETCCTGSQTTTQHAILSVESFRRDSDAMQFYTGLQNYDVFLRF